MTTSTVVKTKYGEDMRRFAVDNRATFTDFQAELVKLYKLNTNFIVKYRDDENDYISITTDEEWAEALRFVSKLNPPILHIQLTSSNQTPAPVHVIVHHQVATQPIINKEKTADIDDDEKEYPALNVSEWTAPCKSTSTNQTPQPNISIIIPRTILETTKKEGSHGATAQSVIDYSNTTTADTLMYSKSTFEFAQKDNEDNALICSSLSRQIAEECSRLSTATSELCDSLSQSIAAQQAIVSAGLPKELGDFSTNTVNLCKKLSQETALMCKTSAVLSMQAEEQIKRNIENDKMLKDQREDLARLSAQTAENSLAMSSSISALVQQI